MQATPNFIVPLAGVSAGLSQVGGKGASLARLAAAGLPVPPGFCITTEAYRRFVAANGLQPRILAALEPVAASQPDTLEPASRAIHQFFIQAAIPAPIAEAISLAYTDLHNRSITESPNRPIAVAVRSSATAEDLPGASFAGQQETYLNIQGAEAVLEAVRKCWASLWTARAIAYRLRQGIPPESVALAVVVQLLVPAEAAGILFTANPLNGRRDEIVINAAWGLGEAIVGGSVTPDTVTVDRLTGRVIRRETAEKQVMTVRAENGTEEQPVPDSQKDKAVLSDEQAGELARYGSRIDELYGMPMDVEWTLAAGEFAIVQARPITSLPACPAEGEETPLEWKTPYPKPLLMRGSSTDLMPDTVSPLFATLGMSIATQVYFKMYDEVMGLRGEDVPIFEVVNGYVYLCFINGSRVGKYFGVHVSTGGKMFQFGKVRAVEVQAKCVAAVDRWRQMNLGTLTAPELLAGVRELFEISAEFLTVCVARPLPMSNLSELEFSMLYNSLIKRREDPAATIFLLGLESMPLRAEKSLFDLAQSAKAQPELANTLMRTPAEEVWADLQSDPVPAPLSGEFATRLAAHLAEFGHITYDLDFMNPVPGDYPIPTLDALKLYLAGRGSNPYTRQQTQESRRRQAEQAISQRLDPLRRKWFRKLLASAQECAVKREDAIANIGLPYPELRRLLRELGQRLAAGGAIAQPEDVYWLEANEADALAAALEKNEPPSTDAAHVETRKAEWRRARKAAPPAVLPEKSWLARMMAPKKSKPDILKGKGVSSGRVTAPACVLRGPEDFAQMHSGDVLVAVATTPAWTPLFAMASAVVTDIGGALSHSSIVAREYGIPAVMATGSATRRIRTGQIVTVDGTSGTVTLAS